MTNEQIAAIAQVTHEANRAYCATHGDHSQRAWELAADWQRESAIAGVRSVLDGSAASPEQQHDGWLAFKAADGWVYGPVKDEAAKTHPCMVPYDQLPPHQQAKDHLFRAIVVALTETR